MEIHRRYNNVAWRSRMFSQIRRDQPRGTCLLGSLAEDLNKIQNAAMVKWRAEYSKPSEKVKAGRDTQKKLSKVDLWEMEPL